MYSTNHQFVKGSYTMKLLAFAASSSSKSINKQLATYAASQVKHKDGVEIITAYTDGVNAYIENILKTPELITMKCLYLAKIKKCY